MRTWTVCDQCAVEHPGTSTRLDVELTDDLLFETVCPRGHKVLQTLEATRFSLLFDFGIFAYLDGYHREAVTSFATSLERFYEFYIRTMAKRSGTPQDVFEQSWKLVSSQSERQIGAFYLMYTREFKAAPPTLPQKQIELRNKVVHKGFIPSGADALNFARSVHDYMTPLVEQFATCMREECSQVFVEERAARAGGRRELHSTSHGGSNFVYWLPTRADEDPSFDAKLKDFARIPRTGRPFFA